MTLPTLAAKLTFYEESEKLRVKQLRFEQPRDGYREIGVKEIGHVLQ